MKKTIVVIAVFTLLSCQGVDVSPSGLSSYSDPVNASPIIWGEWKYTSPIVNGDWEERFWTIKKDSIHEMVVEYENNGQFIHLGLGSYYYELKNKGIILYWNSWGVPTIPTSYKVKNDSLFVFGWVFKRV